MGRAPWRFKVLQRSRALLGAECYVIQPFGNTGTLLQRSRALLGAECKDEGRKPAHRPRFNGAAPCWARSVMP